MKKRLAKKIEKMRRRKAHEALEMVLEINTTQARRRDRTGNKPTASFEFSGVVGSISFRVHPDGWYNGSFASSKYIGESGYFDNARTINEAMEKLANTKKELRDAGKM